MSKRPREPVTFGPYTIHTKKEETLTFLSQVEKGLINPTVRNWDKETWALEHKHANNIATRLLADPAVFKEILYEGEPTGKFYKDGF